tara:strand:+ start:197 stop:1330 length:1134 start_codon:yes stop_codon:yes gene_type:complete
MANYAIMRLQKLKSSAKIMGMARHNFRSIDTPNADPTKVLLNEHKACTGVFEVMEKYKALLPDKVRKNAIHAVDYMITTSATASPRDNQIAIDKGIEWVTERHGEENILMCSIHRDETTPHVHIVAMPLLDGKLNGKHFVGGHRDRLSDLQTEYFELLGDTDLERGVKGSKAKHETIKHWHESNLRAQGEGPKTTSKAELVNRVQLTTADRFLPENAQKRITQALGTVVTERDDALIHTASLKVSAATNQTELTRHVNVIKRQEAAIERAGKRIAALEDNYNNPKHIDSNLEFFTNQKRKMTNAIRSKINDVKGRLADLIARSFQPTTNHGLERRGEARSWASGRERSASATFGAMLGEAIPKPERRGEYSDLQQED